MQVKECKKCLLTKPLTDFTLLKDNRHKKAYTYYQSWCKKCVHERQSESRRKAARERMQEWASGHNPIPWKVLKGDYKGDDHKIYPSCGTCFRRYLPELGCIWCTKVYAEA